MSSFQNDTKYTVPAAIRPRSGTDMWLHAVHHDLFDDFLRRHGSFLAKISQNSLAAVLTSGIPSTHNSPVPNWAIKCYYRSPSVHIYMYVCSFNVTTPVTTRTRLLYFTIKNLRISPPRIGAFNALSTSTTTTFRDSFHKASTCTPIYCL